MIPPGALVLLDTSVVIALARSRELGQRIDRDLGLVARPDRPLISIVTVGEASYLAELWKWGEAKTDALRSLLGQLVIVDLGQGDIVTRYAAIAGHSKRNGLNVGDNDCWIAATAAATNAWLLTTDKHFDHFHLAYVNRVWIDPGGKA